MVDRRVSMASAVIVAALSFARPARADAPPDKATEATVDYGRYYLELSVLVPAVYKGERTARLSPALGSSELRADIDEDWHFTGALMIDFFPLGRPRGQLSSFQNCRERSCISNWLGVQFGTGFDNLGRDWYLGLVIEPVSGIALGLGAAFRKGDFLGPGLSEGMLLPSRDQWVVSSEYMARPYLGIAVTTDIVHAVDRSPLSQRELR